MKKTAILIICVILFQFVALAQANTMYTDKTQYNVDQNQTFTATLYVNLTLDCYGIFLYELTWDPTIATLTNVTNLADWEMKYSYGGGISSGKLSLVNWWMGGVHHTGIVPILDMKFKAIKGGSTDLLFTRTPSLYSHAINWSAEIFEFTCINSSVAVTGGSVPDDDTTPDDDDVTPDDDTTPTDSDGDGVPDTSDICPGFNDNIDTDLDGIPDGCDPTPNGTIPTANQPPVAVISGPTKATANNTVIFNGVQSYDIDGIINSYAWDFGDYLNAVGQIVSHSYSSAGTYIVTLLIVDNNGTLNETTSTIIVSKETTPINNVTEEPAKKEDIPLWIIPILVGVIFAILIVYIVFLKRK